MTHIAAIDELRLERAAEHLHALGARAVTELLVEIGEQSDCTAWLLARLTAYYRLSPTMIYATGSDRFVVRLQGVPLTLPDAR